MTAWEIGFERPWFLLLLGLIPLLWLWSFRSLAGLSRWQSVLAVALRSLVLLLAVLALAEIQWREKSDRVSVIYLVDRSLSVSSERLPAIRDFVAAATREHLDVQRADCVGVITFGREATVEAPPYAAPLALPHGFEAPIDPQHTNLAGALRLAMALFPADAARRVVIVSDGNENIGNVRTEAQALVDAGIGIDVVPLRSPARGDVLVEKVTVPTTRRAGQAFQVRVVLNCQPGPETPAAGVPGTLLVLRRGGEGEVLLAQQKVVVPPGKQVFEFREELATADFFTYSARFTADDARHDAVTQNDQATGFVRVAGKAHILLIEDSTEPGQFTHLIERLQQEEIEVTVQPSNQLFTSLAELQRYDAVVLANVPRSAGDDTDNLALFSDAQIDILVKNTSELGAGLLMLGGPNSFGAGGWTNTKLEEAMPVDFQVKNSQVMAVGALALVIDKSGSMAGEKIEMCKAAAIAAARQLGRSDYIGIVAFDDGPRWTIKMEKATSVDRFTRRINGLSASGGTDMYPAMREAHTALRGVNAAVKHMIVLTDGQTQPADFRAEVERLKRDNITVSAVAIGTDAARPLLTQIANGGGGKFYQVTKPKAIPAIFMREARRVARPLIVEEAQGIPTKVVYPHEALTGIDQFPPITGFVLTTPKDNPLVEIAAVTNRAEEPPLLATWTFGQGRTAVLTTDAGRRWATSWTAWEQYDQLFTQLVRWTLRPSVDSQNFTLTTNVVNDRVQVVLQALTPDGEFLNGLNPTGVVVGAERSPLTLRQTAPGRYVGEFAAPQTGDYFIAVQTGQGNQLLRAGVSVPYAAEYQSRQTNEALLKSLAALTPIGGRPGQFIELPEDVGAVAEEANPFRRDLPPVFSSAAMWHISLLVLAGVFFADVFVRRVLIDWSWLTPLWMRWQAWRAAREGRATTPVPLSRLQAAKAAAIVDRGERQRGVRFEPEPAAMATAPPLFGGDAASLPPEATPTPASLAPSDESQPDGYTTRLLAIKQQARQSPDA